ncbi:rust resistance kinase Lr10-like [Senna tora]|uniref:Rust resistance kinase Lr10-like n=1 Tax=Senna tora TaxID=362788 RepID=A0A834WB16_9FABA|nr:rust resistance kinase Lr10-like [Senna tora]
MAVNGISSSTQPLIPFFKGENYEFWSIKMRTLFMSQELWELVEHGYSASEADEQKLRENKKKDARALFFLQQAVSDDIFSRISAATTSKGAWQTLKTEFQGSSKVITVKLQSLRRTFEMLQMGNSETVQVFLSRASAIVSQMKAYGEKITDETVVLKLLRSLTPKFDHVVAAIEESKDFATYSFDDLMGSLQAHEDRLNKSSTRIEEKAFQVKGESSHTKSDGNVSNRSTSRGGYHARGRGGNRGRGGRSGEQRQVKNNSIKCYYCGKIGHKEADCWTKQRNEEKHANVAEEEESMLFMAHFFDKNFANAVWFLDSGCSNHMTGSKQLFKELDEKETSTVRLGDDKVIQVEGKEHVGWWNNSCPLPETTCGDLVIRFPFRIKGRQPQRCGYPGFALECTPTNHPLLELPYSVKLTVKHINYKSQTIDLYDPSSPCLYSKLENLNVSASPFQFTDDYYYAHTFFNCTPEDRGLTRASCLSSPAYQVYAIPHFSNMASYPISFCSIMFTIPSLPYDFFQEENMLHLMWSDPMCKHCESKGKICGFKNTTTNETDCFRYHKVSPTKLIIAGSILGSLLLLLITTSAIYFIYNFHISRKENRAIVEKFLKDYEALKPTRYSYAEIKRITNQFKEKLGQGAYGVVFKGKISTQYSVAVKILTISQGNGEDFINEVGTMGRIHHVNIVRLIGFCADGFRRALVYEFLPNGSLQNFINSPDNKRNFLEWIYNFLEEREDVRIHIEDEVDAKIAKKLAIVGLWCIQWHPVDRPSMEAVVQMLEGEGDKLEVPPNPFASQGGTGQRATVLPARHKAQALEIIHELE